jgi:hypothetical protein
MSPEPRKSYPLRKIKRLSGGRKAVTIAIGFCCKDGLVMCADRQITSVAGFKSQERKIFRASWWDLSILFSYAGDPDAARVLFGKIRENFHSEFGKSRARLAAYKARAALEKIFTNRHAKRLETLIGIRFRDDCSLHLFRTSGHKVVEGDTEHIGCGDSSALRFASGLILTGASTVTEATILGSYIVSVANRYVDGCSGGPDVTAIFKEGTITEGTRGPFVNTKQKFIYCEEQGGKTLRELLLSGGTYSVSLSNPHKQKPIKR